MADEPAATVEAVAEAATAKVEASGAIVAAAEAKDTAVDAADAAVVAETAADAAVAAAAAAETIAENAATRDAAKQIETFQAELGTCRTEIASLRALVTELQTSSESILIKLSSLSWLTEIEAMAEAETPAGGTSDSAGGKKTENGNSAPAPATKADGAPADPESTLTPETERRPVAGGSKKLRWL